MDEHIPFDEVEEDPPYKVTIVWEKGSETHIGATRWELQDDQTLEVYYKDAGAVEYDYGNITDYEKDNSSVLK